jgi:cytochrome c-type biogenesis protein CcmE
MKKSHITIIIVSAVVAAILISTYTTAMDNTTFDVAREKAGKQVKITGILDKSKEVEYDALKDPNLTVFSIVDSKGNTERVYLHDKQGKPMGLEMSESVTVEGKYDEAGKFDASYMQMKCPSKYNESKHSLSSEKK